VSGACGLGLLLLLQHLLPTQRIVRRRIDSA
jgi:hypothetical protein